MLKSEKSIGIVPVFISHMGCPNDCIFCNQRKINGHHEAIAPEALIDYVKGYIDTMKRDQVELAFFGGSFTGIDVLLQERYLSIALDLKRRGVIHKIRLSTRPDYIDDIIVARLKAFSVDLVELGCQSFDDEVLNYTKRGHEAKDIYSAISVLKRFNMAFGIQLMLGLPGDCYEKFMDSVSSTIALQPSCVRLYPALVIKCTELADRYHKGMYTPLTLDDAVTWTAEALTQFARHNIKVIRIGLQRTDLIDFDGDVIAGPFHPAFGELVHSKVALNVMIHLIEASKGKLQRTPNNTFVNLIFKVNDRQISMAIGNKGGNKLAVSAYLNGEFPSKNLRPVILASPDLAHGTIELVIEEYSVKKEIYK